MTYPLYTVGYRKTSRTEIGTLVAALGTVLVDVRARPTSPIPQFRAGPLRAYFGDRYEQAGHFLGGPGGGGTTTPEGIAWLRARLDREPVLLMCGCANPSECHRHQLIAAPHFPDALHIFGDEVIEAGELARANLHPNPEEPYASVPLDILLAHVRASVTRPP